MQTPRHTPRCALSLGVPQVPAPSAFVLSLGVPHACPPAPSCPVCSDLSYNQIGGPLPMRITQLRSLTNLSVPQPSALNPDSLFLFLSPQP